MNYWNQYVDEIQGHLLDPNIRLYLKLASKLDKLALKNCRCTTRRSEKEKKI